MQKFAVINENLVFKDATVLFSFNVPNNENNYLLYYITDLDTGKKKLMISRIVEEEHYSYIKDIKDKRFNNIKIYIEDLINGNAGKKEIKLNKNKINLEPNICQTITEKDRSITCNNIDDIEWALDNISLNYINSFVYINELNEAIYEVIMSRNKDMKDKNEKENIKGNINIFLLTLFSVSFLIVLIFMGYAEFFN